jgi:hypothetical protein
VEYPDGTKEILCSNCRGLIEKHEPQTTKMDTPWLTISGPFGIFGPHFSGGV